ASSASCLSQHCPHTPSPELLLNDLTTFQFLKKKMNQHSGPATLPRGFRCPDYDEAPKTPEPFAQTDDSQVPSPPNQRLKLRRRVVSQLTAPTQQFLASVAAADVPIPSIEEPEIAADHYDMDGRCPFPEFRYEDEDDLRFLRPGRRGVSAPKTP